MIKKILIYPTLAFLLLLIIATVYVKSGNPAKAKPNIAVENVRLRAPLPGQSVAAGWFDVVNSGGVDELLSASSPISDTIELHTHEMADGVMKMRKVRSVKIDGLQTTHFKPGGLHLMIFNADIPGGAISVPITLEFARSGKLTYDAKIVTSATDMGKMDHSGH